MKKWILKAIVQKTISYLPARQRINHFFQKHITKGVNLNDEHFGYKIQHASDHIRFFAKNKNYRKDDCTVLELGTGWYPIIPIAFYLSGYNKVVSVDLSSWLTKKGQLTAINKFKEWRVDGRLEQHLKNIDEGRWDILMDISGHSIDHSYEDINKQIGLEPRVENLIETTLPDDGFEFICSNNTFEHVYEDVLKQILLKFKSLIKPGGSMSHFIDMSDHFAHFDKSITIYNFLKYSKKQWSRMDNDIQPQNRLRFSDYKEMYASLDIPITEEEIRPGDLSLLKKIDIHEEYANYSAQALAISHGYIISEMP